MKRFINWIRRRWAQRPIKIDAIIIKTDPVDCDLLIVAQRKGRDRIVVRLPNPDPNHFYPDDCVFASGIRDIEMCPELIKRFPF